MSMRAFHKRLKSNAPNVHRIFRVSYLSRPSPTQPGLNRRLFKGLEMLPFHLMHRSGITRAQVLVSMRVGLFAWHGYILDTSWPLFIVFGFACLHLGGGYGLTATNVCITSSSTVGLMLHDINGRKSISLTHTHTHQRLVFHSLNSVLLKNQLSYEKQLYPSTLHSLIDRYSDNGQHVGNNKCYTRGGKYNMI